MLHTDIKDKDTQLDREAFSRIIDEVSRAKMRGSFHDRAIPLWNGSHGQGLEKVKIVIKSLEKPRLEIHKIAIIGPGLNFRESILFASLFPNAEIHLVDPNHSQSHQQVLEKLAKDFPLINKLLERIRFLNASAEDCDFEARTADLVYAAGIIADKQIIPSNEVPLLLEAINTMLKPDGKFICFGLDRDYKK